jgi:hypothetical protein
VSGLAVISSQYHHAWRDEGFSDLSALEADVAFTAAGQGGWRERP